MAKERVYLWDNLKFISIICIIILHSTIPYEADRIVFLRYLRPFINLYPMTLFAIISGFWFKERTTKQLAIIFLWPCFLFSIFNNILGVTSPHYPNYLYNFSYKAGYAMWYLLALFFYSLIIKNLRKRLSPSECIIATIIIAVVIGFLPIPNRILDIQRISRLLPSFAYGFWLRETICKKKVTLPSLCNIRLLRGINILLGYFAPFYLHLLF